MSKPNKNIYISRPYMNEKWKIFSIIKETTQKTNGFGKEFSPLFSQVSLCVFFQSSPNYWVNVYWRYRSFAICSDFFIQNQLKIDRFLPLKLNFSPSGIYPRLFIEGAVAGTPHSNRELYNYVKATNNRKKLQKILTFLIYFWLMR